jgi:predicted MFS family arabinose efflux permease
MSLNSCSRDLAAGLSSAVGGLVIGKTETGQLVHYGWLGWIAIAAALLSVWLASRVRTHESDTPVPATAH